MLIVSSWFSPRRSNVHETVKVPRPSKEVGRLLLCGLNTNGNDSTTTNKEVPPEPDPPAKCALTKEKKGPPSASPFVQDLHDRQMAVPISGSAQIIPLRAVAAGRARPRGRRLSPGRRAALPEAERRSCRLPPD